MSPLIFRWGFFLKSEESMQNDQDAYNSFYTNDLYLAVFISIKLDNAATVETVDQYVSKKNIISH